MPKARTEIISNVRKFETWKYLPRKNRVYLRGGGFISTPNVKTISELIKFLRDGKNRFKIEYA